MTRGQANLVAVAVALLVLSAALGVTLAAGAGAFAAVDSDARDRVAAAGVADRLVAADGPVAVRENVLDRDALRSLDAAALREAVPATRERAVQVRVGGDAVVTAGDPTGATVRRLVLVERREPTNRSVPAVENASVTVGPTASATVTVDRAAGVETLTANGRVVARDPAGLDGAIRLDLPRDRPTELALNGSALDGGETVGVRAAPWETRTAVLEVTVDA